MKKVRIHKILVSWYAIGAILWFVLITGASIWTGVYGLGTFLGSVMPLAVTFMDRDLHYYIMKRNVDFDQYRLDK